MTTLNVLAVSNTGRSLAADGAASGGAKVVLVVWLAVIVVLAVFCISALVSILRSPGLAPQSRLVWVVAVLILQFFGPLAWFLVGRKQVAGYRSEG